MTKAHPKTVWHLSRGDEQHALISERELRLLAELGKLQPNDLLWKPGFDGWRTVHSVPGILNPLRCPEPIRQTSDQTKLVPRLAGCCPWLLN